MRKSFPLLLAALAVTGVFFGSTTVASAEVTPSTSLLESTVGRPASSPAKTWAVNAATIELLETCSAGGVQITLAGSNLGSGTWSVSFGMQGASSSHTGSFSVETTASSWLNLRVTGTSLSGGAWSYHYVNGCTPATETSPVCNTGACTWGIREADGSRVDVRTSCAGTTMHITLSGAGLGTGFYGNTSGNTVRLGRIDANGAFIMTRQATQGETSHLHFNASGWGSGSWGRSIPNRC